MMLLTPDEQRKALTMFERLAVCRELRLYAPDYQETISAFVSDVTRRQLRDRNGEVKAVDDFANAFCDFLDLLGDGMEKANKRKKRKKSTDTA